MLADSSPSGEFTHLAWDWIGSKLAVAHSTKGSLVPFSLTMSIRLTSSFDPPSGLLIYSIPFERTGSSSPSVAPLLTSSYSTPEAITFLQPLPPIVWVDAEGEQKEGALPQVTLTFFNWNLSDSS